jgi:hypothetical protein
MDEILTIDDIQTRFGGEWVLVEDPRMSESLDVQGGKVRCHSKDRDEVYRQAVALRPKRFAVVYTGKMSKDAAIVL